MWNTVESEFTCCDESFHLLLKRLEVFLRGVNTHLLHRLLTSCPREKNRKRGIMFKL